MKDQVRLVLRLRLSK